MMDLGSKLKEVRLTERLTQSEICEISGIKLETWKGYEYGRSKSVSSLELLKITTHPRFRKYALWLVTDEVAPECGQISPIIG
jgi:transcriptional regulator with XRE-family HTH domain